jgi:hypothetical protein
VLKSLAVWKLLGYRFSYRLFPGREEELIMSLSYSRRLPVCELQDLAPGDLVDVSAGEEPCWESVRAVGACEDDLSGDVECDGCRAVIFFLGENAGVLHVEWAADLFARFAADCGPAEIEAENEAQARAAHARYTAAVAEARQRSDA